MTGDLKSAEKRFAREREESSHLLGVAVEAEKIVEIPGEKVLDK